jgi:hypothetical protein
MQYLPNFLYAIGFALHGDVLARLLNGTFGMLAAVALAGLSAAASAARRAARARSSSRCRSRGRS